MTPLKGLSNSMKTFIRFFSHLTSSETILGMSWTGAGHGSDGAACAGRATVASGRYCCTCWAGSGKEGALVGPYEFLSAGGGGGGGW